MKSTTPIFINFIITILFIQFYPNFININTQEKYNSKNVLYQNNDEINAKNDAYKLMGMISRAREMQDTINQRLCTIGRAKELVSEMNNMTIKLKKLSKEIEQKCQSSSVYNDAFKKYQSLIIEKNKTFKNNIHH